MTAITRFPTGMPDRGWRASERAGSPLNGEQRPHRGPFAEALDRPIDGRVAVLVDNRNRADATHAVIAAVAYTIWQQRGGAALDNWFEAERVVSRLLLNSSPPARRRRPERSW